MFTKFVRMLVRARLRAAGHCDGSSTSGHCA